MIRWGDTFTIYRSLFKKLCASGFSFKCRRQHCNTSKATHIIRDLKFELLLKLTSHSWCYGNERNSPRNRSNLRCTPDPCVSQVKNKKKIPYIQYTRSRGVYSCVTGVRTLGWLRNTAKKVDAKKRQYGLKTQLFFSQKTRDCVTFRSI